MKIAVNIQSSNHRLFHSEIHINKEPFMHKQLNNKFQVKTNMIPKQNDLKLLYEDVGWVAYTHDLVKLEKSISNSLKVWTVWSDFELVALARVVGDGYSIIYIQDVLVLSKYQKNGIGSYLLREILEEFKDIRQILLLTDNTKDKIDFYKRNGLTDVKDLNLVSLMK